MPSRRRPLAMIALVLVLDWQGSGAWAAAVKDGTVPKRDVARVTAFVGDYEGRWDTQLSRYELELPVMRLSLDTRNRLTVHFFMDSAAAAKGEELDLLGFGCQSHVGPLLTLKFATAPAGRDEFRKQLDASFDFDWGRCPSRVHAVSSNDLLLSLTQNTAAHEYVATLKLLRKVASGNKMYAVTDAGRREIKVRPKENGGGSLYHPELEYCVLNDMGEIEQCFAQKSELKRFLVPFPFPGMSGVWYTKKSPKLEVVKGQNIEYHEAVFRRAMPAPEK